MTIINKDWPGIGRIAETTMEAFLDEAQKSGIKGSGTVDDPLIMDEQAEAALAKPPKQYKLIKTPPEAIAGLKSELSGKVAEFIRIEDEKKAADADFNERLTDLWDEIRGIQARINEG